MKRRGWVASAVIVASVALSAGPTFAQANGDMGSALLGTFRAQNNSEARAKSNENPMGMSEAKTSRSTAAGASAADYGPSVASKDHRN